MGEGATPSPLNVSVNCLSYLRRMLVLLPVAILAFLIVNAWTILSFWYDKRRAMAGERRVPESNLLSLALIGGSPGALLARHLFRHKTRKQPFSTYLYLILVVQIGAAIGFVVA